MRRSMLIFAVLAMFAALGGGIVGNFPSLRYYAIVLMVGVVAWPLLATHPERGLVLFTFLIPMGRLLRLPGLENTILPVLGVAMGVGFAMRLASRHDDLQRGMLPVAFLALVAAVLLTAVFTDSVLEATDLPWFSPWPGALAYVLLIGFAFLTSQVVRDTGMIRSLLWAIAISNVLLACILILAALGVTPSGLTEVQTIGDVERYSAIGLTGGTAGTGGHLLVGVIATLSLLRAENVKRRLMLILFTALLLAASLLTVNLSVISMICVVAGFFVATRNGRLVPLRAVAGLLATSVALAGAVVASPDFRERVVSRAGETRIEGSHGLFGIRQALWSATADMIQEHPLGVGPGRANLVLIAYLPYDEYLKRIQRGIPQYDPHNTFLSVAGDLGIPSLGVFFLIVAAAVIRSMKRARRISFKADPGSFWLFVAVPIGIVAMLMFGMTSSQQLLKYLWLFIGLGLAAPRIATSSQPSPLRDGVARRSLRPVRRA